MDAREEKCATKNNVGEKLEILGGGIPFQI
jgi:hypothetical protein